MKYKFVIHCVYCQKPFTSVIACEVHEENCPKKKK